MAALRKLTERCEFKDYLEEALRDRLVCGLRSETAQRRLLSEKDLKLQTAYDIAVSMETASRQASELQASGKTDVAQPQKAVGRVAVGRRSSADNKSPPQSCHRCGKSGHHPDRCFYKQQKCHSCGKKGHLAKVCRTGEKGAFHGTPRPNAPRNHKYGKKQSHRTSYVECDLSDTDEEAHNATELESVSESMGDLFTVYKSEGALDSPIVLKPVVNGVTLKMELDTGASVSLI